MKAESGYRQYLAWIFTALSAPIVLVCGGLSWHWVLAAGVGAALYYIVIGALFRAWDTGEPLPRRTLAAFGKGLGGAVLALQGVWLLLAASLALYSCGSLFPQNMKPELAIAALAGLTALACTKPGLAVARCAGVLALLLGIIYAIIGAAAVPEVQIRWLRPWGDGRAFIPALAVLLLPGAALYLRREDGGHAPWGALAALALLPAGAAALCAGCISPALAVQGDMPFYTMTASLSLFSVVQRFEALLSAAMAAGMFCTLCLLTESAKAVLTCAGARMSGKWTAVGFVLLALAAIPITRQLPVVAWLGGSAIFWGIVPLLTLFVGFLKKVRKKAKKDVDKGDSV